MKKNALLVSLSVSGILSFAGGLAACGDDSVFESDGGVQNDAGQVDVTTTTGDTGTIMSSDAGTDATTPVVERVLISYNGSTSSEMVAFNPATASVDGRLTVPGSTGFAAVSGSMPFFIAEGSDQLLLLDGTEPWKVLSSWNVAGIDKPADGGVLDTEASPDAVAVAAAGKAYVLRYTRTKIAVVDTTAVADGGAPTKLIDLSSLVQAGDTDGVPEATAAYYHAGRQRLYVLLGNIDRHDYDPKTYNLLCAPFNACLIAIDTTTDSIVSLGGTALGGGIALPGTNPVLGVKMGYDTTNDRLLILNAGCQPGSDAGSTIVKREIDAVSLATSTATTALSLNTQAFPTQFALLSDTSAVINTYGGAFAWNTAASTLGASIANVPDDFGVDTSGNLLGASAATDGGSAIYVVRTNPADGGSQTLGTNVQSLSGMVYLGGAEVFH